MNFLKLSILISAAILIAGCSSDRLFKEQLIKTLKENPEIVFNTIEENPTEFLMTVQRSSKKAQSEMALKRQQAEEKQLEDAFNNPLKPELTKDTVFKGAKDAPITLVEYSDFECPFCKKGHETVDALMKRYPGKVKFVYKHLPLNFHPQAMITAQYFEAIALQSKEKAFKFHDEVFKNQSKLKQGEKFLKKLAKDLKIDLMKLNKDINSDKVIDKIEKHIQEARKFGISGTPGFVINGIPVKGAYPAEHFVMIIDKLQKSKKLKL
jgi:protein-disulfide isomerase